MGAPPRSPPEGSGCPHRSRPPDRSQPKGGASIEASLRSHSGCQLASGAVAPATSVAAAVALAGAFRRPLRLKVRGCEGGGRPSQHRIFTHCFGRRCVAGRPLSFAAALPRDAPKLLKVAEFGQSRGSQQTSQPHKTPRTMPSAARAPCNLTPSTSLDATPRKLTLCQGSVWNHAIRSFAESGGCVIQTWLRQFWGDLAAQE